MSKPVHTLGPADVVMETDRHVDGSPFKDYFIVTSGEKRRTIVDTYNSDSAFTEEDRHANARLIAAAYNAFDSAASKLGVNAVEMAERMADGSLADLVNACEQLIEDSKFIRKEYSDMNEAVCTATAILAKVRGGGT